MALLYRRIYVKTDFLYYFGDFLTHSMQLIIISDLSTAPMFLFYSTVQCGFIFACGVCQSFLCHMYFLVIMESVKKFGAQIPVIHPQSVPFV
jgi:hypothetical protein